jgi:hypothetical protein
MMDYTSLTVSCNLLSSTSPKQSLYKTTVSRRYDDLGDDQTDWSLDFSWSFDTYRVLKKDTNETAINILN